MPNQNKSSFGKSNSERLLKAISRSSIHSLRQPQQVAQFLKSWLRFPIDYDTNRAVNETPRGSFAELFPTASLADVHVPAEYLVRHHYNVRLDEQIYIGLITQAINARKIFEIGTFDGQTTRYMAEMAGPEAQLFTLDLSAEEFDRTHRPRGFTGADIGHKFRGTPVEKQITRLSGNSTTFDFAPYLGTMDMVFVDAAHDYDHGVVDSRNALRLIKPNGTIVWHDYNYAGLVQAIREATGGKNLYRLTGTTLAVYRTIKD